MQRWPPSSGNVRVGRNHYNNIESRNERRRKNKIKKTNMVASATCVVLILIRIYTFIEHQSAWASAGGGHRLNVIPLYMHLYASMDQNRLTGAGIHIHCLYCTQR